MTDIRRVRAPAAHASPAINVGPGGAPQDVLDGKSGIALQNGLNEQTG
jgi:hypothetical protein